MTFRAIIHVTLKPEVADPAGQATCLAANRLLQEAEDAARLEGLRIGKLLHVSVEAPDEVAARRSLEKVAERLLANPNIENYSIRLLSPGETA